MQFYVVKDGQSMKRVFKRYHMEIGIILALAGIQFSIILKEIIGNSSIELTNFLFVLSILLVVDYNSLLKGNIFKQSRVMTITLLYNLYALMFACIAEHSIWSNVTGIIYTLYVIVLIFAFMTNKKPLDGKFLVDATWLSTGIFSVLLCYLVTDGFSVFAQGIMYLPGGADRLSLSVIAFYQLCSSMLYRPKKKYLTFVKLIFIVCAIYDVLVCSRRGMMVAMGFIVLYHLWQSKKRKVTSFNIYKVFGSIIFAIIAVAILCYEFPGLLGLMQSYINRMISGIGTYFGSDIYGTDAAASYRNTAMNSFWGEFLSGTILQILFGRGYVYWWYDIPYLEAFIDMGFIGGVWYLFLQLIYPIKVFSIKTDTLALRFAQYFGIFTITYNLYSGVPYGQYKFVSLILMIYTANMYKQYSNKWVIDDFSKRRLDSGEIRV